MVAEEDNAPVQEVGAGNPGGRADGSGGGKSLGLSVFSNLEVFCTIQTIKISRSAIINQNHLLSIRL